MKKLEKSTQTTELPKPQIKIIIFRIMHDWIYVKKMHIGLFESNIFQQNF